MKKNLISIIGIVMILGCAASAMAQVTDEHDENNNEQGGGTGYSCTVSSNCYNFWGNLVDGSVSCTGKKCERGYEWVKCDDKKTEC